MKRPELKQKLLELLLQEADTYRVESTIFEEFVEYSHVDIIVWLIYSWQKTHKATNATDTLMLYTLLGKQVPHSLIKDAWYRRGKALVSKRIIREKFSYSYIYNALYKVAPCKPLIDSLLYVSYPIMKQIAAKFMLKEGLKPRDVAVRVELSYNQVYRIKNTRL